MTLQEFQQRAHEIYESYKNIDDAFQYGYEQEMAELNELYYSQF